jgi:hypothetical protein
MKRSEPQSPDSPTKRYKRWKVEAPKDNFVKPDKAYKNLDFLNSKAARMIRITCEMEETHARLTSEGVENVVMVFGSARAMSRGDYQAKLRALQSQTGPAAESQLSRLQKQEFLIQYHDEVTKFGKLFSTWANKHEEENGPCILLGTGGGPGMMEAANKGAFEAGNPSLGFGISVPFEPGLNPYVTKELAFEYHYFFTRKFWMSVKCKGLVVAPGGLGTCDELFEFMTLVQTGKIKHKIPIVLLGKAFWSKVLNFEALVEYGMISEADRDSVNMVDTAEEAMAVIVPKLTELLKAAPKGEHPLR